MGTGHEINVLCRAEYGGYRAAVIRAACAALDFENVGLACEINIEITDNAGIRELNMEFRGKDSATDVLSFPMIEPERTGKLRGEQGGGREFCGDINPENGAVVLGDIIISGERAREQSARINQSLERELMFLTVHSVLHLLGCDHELSEEHDLLMRKKQREILDIICRKV